MKRCSRCGEEKPLSEFYKDRSKSNGLKSCCKACHGVADRKCGLARTFGLTLEQYDGMLQQQGGVCDICKRPEITKRNGKVKRLYVDHDHKTGWVRGLLCNKCNTALGLIRDDPKMLLAIQYYLKKNEDDLGQPRIAA
jgi:hypothetical protein